MRTRIDVLFRQSGLYREKKWNRQGYRERTIHKVLEHGQFYTGGRRRHCTGGTPWYQRAQGWTGPLTTINAQEVPPWHV